MSITFIQPIELATGVWLIEWGWLLYRNHDGNGIGRHGLSRLCC